MMRPKAPRVTENSLRAKRLATTSPFEIKSICRLARSSRVTSPARAAATMATTPSSEEFTKKPRWPKLIPRMGTRVLPTRRAVRSMVPSPPSETTMSNDATSTSAHVSLTDSMDNGVESSS